MLTGFEKSRTTPRRLIAAFAVTMMLLMSGGAWFYIAQRNRLKDAAESDLSVMAQWKASQIVEWRAERLRNAEVLAQNPLLPRALGRYLTDPGSAEAGELLKTLRRVREGYRYNDILVVDTQGNMRGSLDGAAGHLSMEEGQLLSRAIQERRAVFSDLVARRRDHSIYLDIFVPIFASNGGERTPAGGIILRMDAGDSLFPLIQSWPTDSRSAETLLVRRDGESVLYLNELRHQKDTALKLRFPMSRKDLPAVMAVEGRSGVVYGIDYRGVRVMAALRGIPGSAWAIVSKEDEVEVFEAWRFSSVFILALLLVCAAAGTAVFMMFWERNEKSRYIALFETEAAWHASEERYRITLMSIGDGVIATDANGAVRLMNPVAEALTGWSHGEASGRPLEDVFRIVAEATRRTVENPVRRVVREGHVVGLANHSLLLSRAGREHSIADSGAPIRDTNGEIVGVVLVFRDQTDMRRAEEALRQSEEHYRSLFSNMLNGFAFCEMLYENGRPDDFIYLEVNDAFVALTGLKDVTGKKASEAIPGIQESDAQLIETYGRVAQTGTPVRFETFVQALEEWYSISVYCPRKGYFVTVFDVITEHKKAEAGRLLLSTAIDQAAEMIVITDADGTIQYVNPAFEAVTGYTREEAVGRTPRILKSGAHDHAFYRGLWDTIAGGKTWKGRFQNKKKDGTLYTEDAIISPVHDTAGTIINYVAAKHDATHELQLEAQFRQSQKMESVGMLAGGVAHDFNNMLQVISSYAEFSLQRVAPEDPLSKNLHQILTAARRSAELTGQLLAFARKQTANPKVLILADAVEGTLKMLRRLIGEDIDLAWTPGNTGGKVRIDPSQLDQVLANLAVNARDAIEGVGKLTIETSGAVFDEAYCVDHPGYVPGEYMMLGVSDNGRGMDKEIMSHLFEPFFTTKALGKGTGLGLATVYGIVRQNEGFINIYSEPGVGTSFKIYLPRINDDEAPAPVENAAAPPRGGKENVLVVEDEEAILELCGEMLHGLGYSVLEARTPTQAIRLAEMHPEPIHLLITDVVMPEMNGRELAGRLGAIKPGLKCLYMSGYTANVIAHQGVLEEGVSFIPKPFSLAALAGKVRAVLDKVSRD